MFACWREPRQNPWMMIALQEAYKYVPRLPEMGPDDPGPFSFANEQRVRRILSEAGFSLIAMEACDVSLDVAFGRGLEAAVGSAPEVGPVSRALEGQPPEVMASVGNAIRRAVREIAQYDQQFATHLSPPSLTYGSRPCYRPSQPRSWEL